MIRRFALLVAFAALACAGPAAALADSTILVKFASTDGSGAKVAALGDDVTGTTVGGVKVVDPQPGESVSDALTRYRARPDVLYAEPNRVLHLLDLSPPSDPGYSSQWALDAISALGGWSRLPRHVLPEPVGTGRDRRYRGRRDAPGSRQRLGPERDLPQRRLHPGRPDRRRRPRHSRLGHRRRDDRQRARHLRPLLRLAADRRACLLDRREPGRLRLRHRERDRLGSRHTGRR